MNYELIGMMNQHLIFSKDENNVSSTNNATIFGQIIQGNYDSPQVDYLLNMGSTRLSDTKSIQAFNESNLAAYINNSKINEEILDGAIELNKKTLKIKTKLVEAMESRHSTRRYTSSLKMNLEELGTILKYSFGLAKRKENYFGVEVSTRYHGSGGGLYPIDVYILINRLDGIKYGVYKYQPMTHSLLPLNTEIDIGKVFPYGSFDLVNYSFYVFYEYDLNRNYVKYGELSLMISLIEVGLMAQNMDLVCSAMGFTTCQAAGYQKRYIEKKLDLDGVNSHIVYTQLCGKE